MSQQNSQIALLVNTLRSKGSLSRSFLDKMPAENNDIFNIIKLRLDSDATQYNFSQILKNLNSNNDNSYSNAATQLQAITNYFSNSLPTFDARIIAVTADGNVLFDSAKSNNTNANAQDNTITSANHNTRVSVITANMMSNGYGYEAKWSSTLKNYEYYVAKRFGVLGSADGVIRYSVYRV